VKEVLWVVLSTEWARIELHSLLLVVVAAHSLVSSPFLHSDEFSLFKVAEELGFFNKLLVGLF
jgi:hypothetical protein